jgi:broad specificity phosphatase PhoE
VCLRIEKLFHELYKDYAGKTLLLVTHGFVSRAIHKTCMGIDIGKLRDFYLGNCELAVYQLNMSTDFIFT